MNDPSSLNSMPVPLDADVTDPAEDKGANPHGQVRDGRERARGRDVELQHVSHVLGEVRHHCVVAPIVADLGSGVSYVVK